VHGRSTVLHNSLENLKDENQKQRNEIEELTRMAFIATDVFLWRIFSRRIIDASVGLPFEK
jgi:hypothetical protein